LSIPNLDEFVNQDAAHLIVNSPKAYEQIILDCALASQRASSIIISCLNVVGLEPVLTDDVKDAPVKAPSQYNEPSPGNQGQKRLQISFESYHETWKNIATAETATFNRSVRRQNAGFSLHKNAISRHNTIHQVASRPKVLKNSTKSGRMEDKDNDELMDEFDGEDELLEWSQQLNTEITT
jgi:hypothetical protein